jgi:Tol biopolymer transport system component/DNA-binding winged helix-turn-helix (wHTH) protein
MQVPANKSRIVGFGVFEVDLQEAELRKSGIRIKLQEQPFQILTTLLEHPGQTVTREELRRQLWPADTFVDFDHSLNSSIKKLREALGDDSENPRFIETLHRRGYRFIAPVDGPGAAVVERSEQVPPVAATPAESKNLARWQKWAAIVVLVVGATLLGLWVRSPLPPPRVLASQELTNDGLPKLSLVTDGNRIYFTENSPNYYRIAQVSIRGGEIAAVEVPFSDPVVDAVSAERSELLIERFKSEFADFHFPMWSMPLPAGSPRRLGDLLGHDAVWAPNGNLLYAKGNDLYIAEHDGSNPRKFASAPDFPTSISFSPDGTRLRFTATNLISNISSIWEARADGSDMHPLFPGWNSPPAECCGRWTPDGKYYVFQSTREGATNIWIVREGPAWWRKASREPVQLTVGPLQLSRPLPSTDGQKLFAIGTHQRAELVRYDSKSGEFVPYLGAISRGDVDFSRDGQWVTYVSYPEGALWRGKLDGSARLQLTYPPMHAVLPHWSPDGQQIAFSGATPSKSWKVFLISRDGGSPRPVTTDQIVETDTTWSPDGKILAFGHYEPIRPDQTFIEFFNLETQQISEVPGSRGIFAPRWSPDGRFIITASHRSEKLILYDVKDKTWRQLGDTLPPGGYGYMAWSQDSAYVYFDGTVGGDSGYFRLRASDAKLDKIVDFKKLRRFGDEFFGAWSGLGPGDTPLFMRDISTQEIYALDLQLP